MRAITVKQPWAWAIAAGHKTIENRSAGTRYRGPLAIHAGAAWSERGERLVPQLLPPDVFPPKWWTKPGTLPTGALIAVCELVDAHPDGDCCRPWGESEYTEACGRVRRAVHHLVLEDIRPLPEPIPARGQLSLWRPDADLFGELARAEARRFWNMGETFGTYASDVFETVDELAEHLVRAWRRDTRAAVTW